MKKRIYAFSILFILIGLASCDKQSSESNSVTDSGVSDTPSVSSTADSSFTSVTPSNSEVSSSSSSDVMDPTLASKFAEALKKDYSNVTYTEDTTMNTTMEGLGSFESSYNLVEMVAGDVYQVIYTDDEGIIMGYVETLTDGVKLYTYDSNNKCYYQILDNDTWESVNSEGNYVYGDYFLTHIAPSDFNISVDDFDYVDGMFVCKSASLNKVGNVMFPLGFTTTNFSSITLKLDGDYVSEVSFAATASEEDFGLTSDISSSMVYEYVGETVVDLPTNAEEYVEEKNYIDPKLAEDLTPEQASILENALTEVYTSYTCDYSSLDSDGYNTIFETLYYQDGKYDVYLDLATEYGNSAMQMQYYLEETADAVNLYSLDDKNVVTSRALNEEELADYYPQSYAPSEFGLSAASFGVYENTYLFKSDALKALSSAAGRTISSIQVVLNDNNQVASLQIVYSYAATSDFDAYTTTELFTYSNFNATSVTLPTVNASAVNALTSEQSDAFVNATNADFSNVTMYDNIFGGCFFMVGNNVEVLQVSESQYYLSTYKYENGKYYAEDMGEFVEIPFESNVSAKEYGYNYYVPNLDFSYIDTTKLTYDSFNKVYLIDYAEVDIANFLFYYSVDLDDYTFSKIAFKLDKDGHISEIQLYFVQDGVEYSGNGLSLFDYGTTQLYSDLMGE